MRVAVIADIHANLAAFEAVSAAWGSIDEVWCLGDVVGYGPDPNECVAKLRQLPHVCVPGNHDYAAIGRIDVSDFNPAARLAAQWTARTLDAEARAYLGGLAEIEMREPFTLVHGSPRGPVWEYMLDVHTARASFTRLSSPYCLVGHSHVPLEFVADPGGNVRGQLLTDDGPRRLAGARRILNPGSVGQPRDGDPRASFAIVERGPDGDVTLELIRVPYQIEVTQERMRAAGLPDVLISRLAEGR